MARRLYERNWRYLTTGKAEFFVHVKGVIRSGDTALTHSVWAVATPEPTSGYALEVSRRQPDGSWRWLISDPFTVGGLPAAVRRDDPAEEEVAA